MSYIEKEVRKLKHGWVYVFNTHTHTIAKYHFETKPTRMLNGPYDDVPINSDTDGIFNYSYIDTNDDHHYFTGMPTMTGTYFKGKVVYEAEYDELALNIFIEHYEEVENELYDKLNDTKDLIAKLSNDQHFYF